MLNFIITTIIMIAGVKFTAAQQLNAKTATVAEKKETGNAPHISGDIYVSISGGTIRADLTVSRLPRLNNYSIGLNAGLNIQDFRDSTGKSFYYQEREYRHDKSEESLQYWFPDNNKKGRFMPRQFKITYMGLFPVHTDSSRLSDWGDWKGNIAFNGKTIRAAEQTAWYPVIYDISEDKVYQNVTFDVTVHAPGARAIYMNGCPPQYGAKIQFKSDNAFPMMLFAGDFDFKKYRNTNLVNTTLSDLQANVLDSCFTKIRSFYEKNLQIPYGADITLLASTPVSKRNDWLFVTYPTIASISPKNWLNSLVDKNTGLLTKPEHMSFMAHELAHYYFGSVVSPNSTLRWVFLEGFAEYLSLQATRELLGDGVYNFKLSGYKSSFNGADSLLPLSEVKISSDVSELYRYSYVPLLLTALERQIGKAQMWKWFNKILTSPNPETDYAFLKQSLLDSGVASKAVEEFEKRYLTKTDSLKVLKEEL